MIEKILVAFDGSESANKALDFALDIAAKYSAEILIVSILQPVITPMFQYPELGVSAAPPATMISYAKELRDRHKKVLSAALRMVKKVKPSLKVSTKLLEGRPSNKIVETAKQGNFDIIVLGSQGLGGIKKFFLGSVSHRVADEASCPVLIVK